MTRKNFVELYAPQNQDNLHPDLVAVECSNLEGFEPSFIEETITRNGNVLDAGVYLYPDGEVIELTN